jgi:hypothetical protein
VAETIPLGAQTIDFYGPVDLDLVLDNNQAPDALPDPNLVFTVRGVIGDHPDTDVITFPTGSDTDIFKVTLLAGQIVRLGAMQGAARFVGRTLLNSAGEVQFGNTADSLLLPVNPLEVTDDTSPSDFLIKTTGVYFIVLSNADFIPDDIGPGLVPQIPAGDSNTGSYSFTLQVFDDRNSGFAAGTDAGNGDNIVNAPPIITFAGNDGIFGTGDDRTSIPIGEFTFFLDPGPDGAKGTNDDVVSGSNAQGIVSTRTGRTQLTTTIDSAIGPRGHSGFPEEVTSDVDVYHLNNGQPIAAGKKITVKIRLAEIGANLGGFSQLTFSDFTSSVQFGIFDVTDATAIDDGKLVASPTDFKPAAGTPNTVIAQRGDISYGYDENGDFYLTFVTPGKLGGTGGEAARYAVYLQGAFNTDYQIVVSQSDTPQTFALPHSRQNVFLETRGGVLDWLEAGGLSTKLLPFSGSVLGFTGTINSQPIDQYILSNLVSTLQGIANASGLAITFSTNVNDFEFQPFSTVFLSAGSDPTTAVGTGNFGYSEHSDAFNADLNDEAVVFAPSLATLGYTPSQTDVDTFVQSLAAAVGRRMGELMGLRITDDSAFGDNPVDIMSANSVFNVPDTSSGATYAYIAQDRALSGRFDSVVNTDFFLGQQNAFELLSKFLAP